MSTEMIPESEQPLPTTQPPNPNLDWARQFLAALVGAGLRSVVMAPGSRSTPLVLALAAEPALRRYVQLDERSAAFLALGLALAEERPAALVCTSGTAAANFFPAIIEARMSGVPLLVLTADRPPELRHSGANQTIDQVKLYGDQVLWAVDMAVPATAAPAVVARYVQTTAVRAYATADGIVKGPVHINFPFRKPLEPAADEPLSPPATAAGPVVEFRRAPSLPTAEQVEQLATLVQSHARGLIVCGPRCPGGPFPAAVAALSQQTGYPILADPLSGVRYGAWVGETAVLSSYETFLQREPGWPEPELILRLGAVPTSRWLNEYLERGRPRHRLHLRESGVWADDSHRVSGFWAVNETAVCQALAHRLPARGETDWLAALRATDSGCWARLRAALAGPFFDGAAVADLVDHLPAGSALFAGNSLPIRHLDQYGQSRPEPLRVYGNRGASGIDGNISTALGVAAGSGRPLVAVVGDITFFHDMNGLLPLGGLGGGDGRSPALAPNITIVVLNNGGGGIFRRLPIARLDPPFTDLFLTPHGLTFAPVARLYGLPYELVSDRATFRRALAAALANPGPNLIELHTDGAADERRRREINAIVNGEAGH